MQDYTESERIEKESNIAFITAKNTQPEAKEFYHTNILISLLKECTKEKLLNSCSIRRVHYQILLIQIIGFSSAFIYNYFYESISNDTKASPIILTTILSMIVVEFIIVFTSTTLLEKTKLSRYINIFNIFIRSQSIGFLLIMFFIYCFGMRLGNTWVNTYFISLAVIYFLLTSIFSAKLKNMYIKLKVVDSNLAKAIRTTSQYREHIASNFIAKTKLEIALKTAEDALENPRLYF
jgi:L-asparagine transporter-like permease